MSGELVSATNEKMKSETHNRDCLISMRDMPDKVFDLAIVDVPYGLGEDGGKFRDRLGGGHRILPKKAWDTSAPPQRYFDELFRVSADQIIWGANHFNSKIWHDSPGWIYWDKLMGGDFADGELAWTSFDRPLKKFTYCNKRGGAIHPTQKPVALYKWLLTNYAKPGDTILDTHLGSGSSRIAAYDLGFDFCGYELDADYHAAQEERFANHIAQANLFEGPRAVETVQTGLF